MGNCVECCKAPDVSGHQSASHYGSRTVQSTAKVERQQLAIKTTTSSSVTSATSHPIKVKDIHIVSTNAESSSSRHSVTGEKKTMFTPYSKLPPIKSESKRLSFISKECSENKIHALFEKYKEADEDLILAEGVERFCDDLEVRPDEFVVLVLAWKFNAETMCKFTREQFVTGCKSLCVDSIRGIQSKFPDLLSEVQNKQSFKDLYSWTFRFGLDVEINQRTLPIDMAMSLWKLIFSQQEPTILPRWLNFLQKHQNIRGISRDTWDMFLNFTEQVGDDLSSYDDTEAWPSLLDDFVEYENDCQNQNVEMD